MHGLEWMLRNAQSSGPKSMKYNGLKEIWILNFVLIHHLDSYQTLFSAWKIMHSAFST